MSVTIKVTGYLVLDDEDPFVDLDHAFGLTDEGYEHYYDKLMDYFDDIDFELMP